MPLRSRPPIKLMEQRTREAAQPQLCSLARCHLQIGSELLFQERSANRSRPTQFAGPHGSPVGDDGFASTAISTDREDPQPHNQVGPEISRRAPPRLRNAFLARSAAGPAESSPVLRSRSSATWHWSQHIPRICLNRRPYRTLRVEFHRFRAIESSPQAPVDSAVPSVAR